MKDLVTFCFLFLAQCFTAVAQDLPQSRCEIIDEDVYIYFDESCLQSADDLCAAIEDFKKYNLSQVIETGAYASWKMDGWSLEKMGKTTYRLHKKLSLFDQVFNREDKFKIDTRFWLSPLSDRLPKEKSGAINEPARVDRRGNVEFVLKGYPLAKQVILSGSFNNWHEQAIKMVKHGDVWKLTMKMPPGIYEYKFIVDGNWITDPDNPFSVINQHDTYNSILVVGKAISFTLKGHSQAKKVTLSGSFNNWDKKGVPMVKTKDGWKVSQKLPPGKHYYKFIIDNKDWIADPNNPLQERDENGYINSVLVVF